MEQQLIEALEKAQKPEDIDDVSMAMIMSRVTNALSEVRNATTDYLEKIEQINKAHETELKLGGFTLVLNTTDSLTNNEPMQMCVLGSKPNIMENLKQIMEKI